MSGKGDVQKDLNEATGTAGDSAESKKNWREKIAGLVAWFLSLFARKPADNDGDSSDEKSDNSAHESKDDAPKYWPLNGIATRIGTIFAGLRDKFRPFKTKAGEWRWENIGKLVEWWKKKDKFDKLFANVHRPIGFITEGDSVYLQGRKFWGKKAGEWHVWRDCPISRFDKVSMITMLVMLIFAWPVTFFMKWQGYSLELVSVLKIELVLFAVLNQIDKAKGNNAETFGYFLLYLVIEVLMYVSSKKMNQYNTVFMMDIQSQAINLIVAFTPIAYFGIQFALKPALLVGQRRLKKIAVERAVARNGKSSEDKAQLSREFKSISADEAETQDAQAAFSFSGAGD